MAISLLKTFRLKEKGADQVYNLIHNVKDQWLIFEDTHMPIIDKG